MSTVPAIAVSPRVAVTHQPAVSVTGLTKSFRNRRTIREALRAPFRRDDLKALNDVTFTVGKGEFFGMLGPNGAGKTTLFKTLATLITPDEGEIRVEGLDIVRDAGAIRGVMTPVIADERSLRWRLSAYENVRLFAVLYGIPPNEVEARIREVLAIVSLDDTGEKMVGEFSSGMKQRLMIARALLPRPRILLLDEPTRGLDPLSARRLRRFLKDVVCGERGCTILLATHSTEEAFDLCDRVAIMNMGHLLVSGRTVDLVESYADDRYSVYTTEPQHPAWTVLANRVQKMPLVLRTEPKGWSVVELSIPGGADDAAAAIRYLVAEQVPISRFERVPLSLAGLIERVLREHVP
jgi:ABC-2 type transport system ATP-binding protein